MKKFLLMFYPEDVNNSGAREDWGAWAQKYSDLITTHLPFVPNSGIEASKDEKIELKQEMYPAQGGGILEAEGLDKVMEAVNDSPLIKERLGSIRVYEVMEMGMSKSKE